MEPSEFAVGIPAVPNCVDQMAITVGIPKKLTHAGAIVMTIAWGIGPLLVIAHFVGIQHVYCYEHHRLEHRKEVVAATSALGRSESDDAEVNTQDSHTKNGSACLLSLGLADPFTDSDAIQTVSTVAFSNNQQPMPRSLLPFSAIPELSLAPKTSPPAV